jgi:hypothetical protein
MTALALSLGVIYHMDKNSLPTFGRDDPETSDTEANDVMPQRPAGAPVARFAEFSRVDLHEPTIGAYEYKPSVGISAVATKHQTATRQGQRSWYSFAPPTRSQPSPVVILFHGAGRSGLSMIDMWQSVARKYGVVLIAPNFLRKRWPYTQPGAHFIEQILDEMNEKSPVDRNKIFLFGHSSGAVYAQALVNRRTGPWRAAATHGGFATSEYLSPAGQAKPLRM